MCLLLVAHNCCAGYRLVVAANRDEFHERPTAPAARWEDLPQIAGGRDLEANGTWLAVDQRGRFATITNVRSGKPLRANARSRGLIVNDFLTGDRTPTQFSAALARYGDEYHGFNLLSYADAELVWYSNQAAAPQRLKDGIYTLSNAQLDTAWPKTERLRKGFADFIARFPAAPVEGLLEILRDGRKADHSELPDTGIGQDMERVLSSIFIEGGSYGTRCSTVILIDEAGQLTFHERRYDGSSAVSGDTRISFELAPSGA
jgi:uncharacterized protein with NRDE domain